MFVIESQNVSYTNELLFFFSLLALLFAVNIIVTNNPIVSVLFLIGLFVTISIYLMLLGLYFIGLSYLLVYVGAISILFLFILMLINVRTSELLTEGKNSIPLAIITLVCFNYTINYIVPYSVYVFDAFSKYLTQLNGYIISLLSSVFDANLTAYFSIKTNKAFNTLIETNNIASSTSNTWDTSLVESNHITSIGNILYGEIFIFLIITGFILLLAMVGCIVITIKRNTTKEVS